jgi:hypothetical protein
VIRDALAHTEGQMSVIASEDYIRSGIRARSRKIVERELGLRPEREMLAARDRLVGETPNGPIASALIYDRKGENSLASARGSSPSEARTASCATS